MSNTITTVTDTIATQLELLEQAIDFGKRSKGKLNPRQIVDLIDDLPTEARELLNGKMKQRFDEGERPALQLAVNLYVDYAVRIAASEVMCEVALQSVTFRGYVKLLERLRAIGLATSQHTVGDATILRQSLVSQLKKLEQIADAIEQAEEEDVPVPGDNVDDGQTDTPDSRVLQAV